VAVIGNDLTSVADTTLELGHPFGYTIPVQHVPVTPNLLKSLQCDLLIVALSDLSSDKLAEITQIAEQAGLPITLLPALMTQERRQAESIDMHGVMRASVITADTSWHYEVIKRVVDLALSSLLLLLFTPLFILIAILIRIDSPGPALFVQKRVGRDRTVFDIFKFRSMYVDSPRYDRSPTRSSDPRITRIGRLLRRSSLDELPQLLNVFLGNMSLVGPRPEMPFLVQRFSSRHEGRLQVVPGITGLWQLSEDRAFPIHENIHHDLYYIRNRTLSLDIAILIHTLFFAMRGGV
jgi:lipopolysaccharide/colanic/teichoic acid biosynthesis glycosyltransferase